MELERQYTSGTDDFRGSRQGVALHDLALEWKRYALDQTRISEPDDIEEFSTEQLAALEYLPRRVEVQVEVEEPAKYRTACLRCQKMDGLEVRRITAQMHRMVLSPKGPIGTVSFGSEPIPAHDTIETVFCAHCKIEVPLKVFEIAEVEQEMIDDAGEG